MACPITEYSYSLATPGLNLSLYNMEKTGAWVYNYTLAGGKGENQIQNSKGINKISVTGNQSGTLVIDFTNSPGKPPAAADITWQTT